MDLWKKYKNLILIIILLCLGVIYRLYLTSNNNFIFNMDNARDLVDVREMVVLHKFRLVGPTSAIQGVFDGPSWYYLLAVPFIVSGGDPYSEIILMIILWVIGGYFLMKITQRFGTLLMVTSGVIWIASNFVLLGSAYSFNPNPILFLTPVFIYYFEKYLQTNSAKYFYLSVLLGGIFVNCELNTGIFLPIIILISLLITKQIKLFKTVPFWVGVGIYVLFFVPQIIFDLKHHFIMTQSLIHYITSGDSPHQSIIHRFNQLNDDFFNVLLPTFMNARILTQILVAITFILVFWMYKLKNTSKDLLIKLLLPFILVPYVGYIFMPVTVNSWHLVGVATASIILSIWSISQLEKISWYFKSISLSLMTALIIISGVNIYNYIQDLQKPNLNPSSYANEISAINYVYKHANNQNFKVYEYIPSVIDYQYQYLFWWYGKKTYGFIPTDYAYSPNEPEYISNKAAFSGTTQNYHGLIFLIKEPDRLGYRDGWEGKFKQYQLINQAKVGPFDIDTRLESTE